jgi:hypothetical protein
MGYLGSCINAVNLRLETAILCGFWHFYYIGVMEVSEKFAKENFCEK